MKIGVLALQGDFREHRNALGQLGVEAVEVRLPEQLADLDAIIIPGGESTAIGKLARIYDLIEPLRQFASRKAMWGTCAGMVFMAREVTGSEPLLAVMDIEVERNAFGRQIDSFISAIAIEGVTVESEPFEAVFIRAPRLTGHKPEKGAVVLSRLADGTAVAARQGHLLVTSFHPELTGDLRLHRFFVELAQAAQLES